MSVFSCANHCLTMPAFIKLMPLAVTMSITADVRALPGKWLTQNVILKILTELPAIILTLHFRQSYRIILPPFQQLRETRGRSNFLVEH